MIIEAIRGDAQDLPPVPHANVGPASPPHSHHLGIAGTNLTFKPAPTRRAEPILHPQSIPHPPPGWQSRAINPEEDIEELGDVPEMDSPGKTSTSEWSSSMCSTPSISSAGMPLASGSTSRLSSISFGAINTPLTTPFGSPPSRPLPYLNDTESTAPSPIFPLQDQTQHDPHATVRRTTSLKLDASRSIPFPTFGPVTSGMIHEYDTSPCHVSCPTLASSLSLAERSKSLPNLPRCVTFCDDPPAIWPCCDGDEYDRSPHPVVIRLSYRDVLELREMKVELGIVTKRQTVVGGGPGGFAGRKMSDPSRAGTGGPPGLHFGSGGRSSPLPEEAPNPPSPSALFSSFPSSARLIMGLQRIPDPQPPRPAIGMGMSVEPSFGLDSYARTSPSIGGPGGSPSRRGRTISNSSLRDDGTGSLSGNGMGMGPKRVQRKTSGDFSVEEVEKESEFKAELRAAREELERQEAKEAVARAGTMGGRATSADIRRDPKGSSSANGAECTLGGSSKARTSSFFNTAPGATLNSGPIPSGNELLAPPGRSSRPTGLQMLTTGTNNGHRLHSPLPERSPSPGGPRVGTGYGEDPEIKGGMLVRPARRVLVEEVSALFPPVAGSEKRSIPIVKPVMTFHSHAKDDPTSSSSATTISSSPSPSGARPASRRQGSYTSPASMIRPPSPIIAPYTRSFPLSVSTIAANVVPTIGHADQEGFRAKLPTPSPKKESRALMPPSPVLRPFASSAKS